MLYSYVILSEAKNLPSGHPEALEGSS